MVETEAQYKIESGVPLPPRPGRPRKGLTAALLALKPGDSMLVSGVPTNRIGGCIQYARRLGANITVRAEGAGTRIWCLHPASAAR